MNIVPQEFVAVTGSDITTDSRTVARHFNKPHKTVLRAIDKAECSEEFGRHNFVPTSYLDSQGKTQREVRMTKDAFMFVVMGFTGREAARIKEAFIAAFNRMADFIRTKAAEQWERHVAAIQRAAAETALASMYGRGLGRFGRIKPDLHLAVEQSRPQQYALALS